MIKNDTKCNGCGIHFDRVDEVDYYDSEHPCCPRCGSTQGLWTIYRENGKVVKV